MPADTYNLFIDVVTYLNGRTRQHRELERENGLDDDISRQALISKKEPGNYVRNGNPVHSQLETNASRSSFPT